MDLFIAVVVALVCAYEARFYLHMLQLESYQLDGYLRYLKRNGGRMVDSTIVIGAGALILHYLLSLLGWLIFKKADLFVGRLITLAAFAALAILTKTEVTSLIMGGLFIAEAVSVIIQVVSFKATGKRVFLMAPIHHHFEKKGWAETKVVIRFWIVSAAFAALGFALYFQLG